MAEHGFTMTRVFDAPRERVWSEWTDPAAFADWFGAPTSEVPLDSVVMDVRPGGAWGLTMLVGPDRKAVAWKGEYLEVDPPERLVLTMSDQPHEDRYEHVTVDLVDLGDGRTEMHLEQRGHGPPEMYVRAEAGWGGFFDRVAERLA